MTLSTGQIVNNRYRIARLLGQGGMGAVYRAWDLALNIPVALKEMIPQPGLDASSLAQLRAQFQREAHVLASLSHPNLPRVSDFFEWGGNSYLVMDFVEGESLAQLIARQGPLPEAQVTVWAAQLLDALAACHARGIIHRDIKPQNIIIRPDGQAVLVDFGLVKMWDPKHPHTQLIVRGMGTPEYASPEHFHLSGHHTEPRSDLYSLGATLYHALTGQEPPSAIERSTHLTSFSPPPNLGRGVQPQIGQTILRAMSIDLNERFASASEMMAAMQSSAYKRPTPPVITPVGAAGPAAPTVPYPLPAIQAGRWKQEMLVGAGMALIGTLMIPLVLYPASMTASFYIGRSLFALILGAVGWFAGDLIFQALARPEQAAAAASAGRPTQRLVAFTRRMARRLTTAQQIVLLVISLAVILPLVAIFGPLLGRSAFMVNYVPAYAPIGPLAWAAVGRRPWRAAIAHTLITTLSMIAMGQAYQAGEVFLACAAGGLLMEGFAFLMERALLRRPWQVPMGAGPACVGINQPAARFCSTCGAPLQAVILCPRCGQTVSAGSRFCNYCGAPLSIETTLPLPAPGTTGLLSPQTLLAGRYTILRRVGKGGMGAVYQAADSRIPGKTWAIKEMSEAAITDPLERQQALDAFRQEALMLASLDHRNLPKVTDHFSEGGRQYLVMDFIEGETLKERLERQGGGPLPVDEVLGWADQLCDVLAYLHSQNPPVIFRDIKPGNIMVTPDGTVKLIDFGIARLFKPGRASDTAYFGTAGYAPREQYGRGQTDGRSDIYALGATLHHLLTGVDPTDNPFHFEDAHRLNGRVPVAVAQALTRALADDPKDRWQRVEEMRAALQGQLTPPAPPATTFTPVGTSVMAGAPSALSPAALPTPAPRTFPRWIWAAGGLFALGLLALFLLPLFRGTSPAINAPPSLPTSAPAFPPPPTFTALPTPVPPGPTVTSQAESLPPPETPTPRPSPTPSPTSLPPTPTKSPTPKPSPTPSPSPLPPTPTNLPERIVSSDGSVMILIPAGPFLRGSSAAQIDAAYQLCLADGYNSCSTSRFDDEGPQREIYLDAFYIDLNEVTNADFARFVAATNYRTQAERVGYSITHAGDQSIQVNGMDWRHPAGPDSSLDGLMDHPVVHVSYDDAVAYCRWLGKRLPTEAEWEKAARGAADARIFPWGDSFFCGAANLDDDPNLDPYTTGCPDGWLRTAPVGSYPAGASPYGVLDMTGNVREWVADWYDQSYYATSVATNPMGPTNGTHKVTRGGSWFNNRVFSRLTYRHAFPPTFTNSLIGFRCAADAP